MKKAILSFFLIAVASVSYAQSSCPVKRAYAFYTVTMPGMIMRDANGREMPPNPNVERFIYIECSGTKMPVIESVLYNNITYKTALSRVSGMTVPVGKKAADGQDYNITTSKGYTLWKIDLVPANDEVKAKENCKNIIIKGKTGGKPCKNYIYRETEIASLPSY